MIRQAADILVTSVSGSVVFDSRGRGQRVCDGKIGQIREQTGKQRRDPQPEKIIYIWTADAIGVSGGLIYIVE